MELELRQDYMSCWDSVFRSTIMQEESAETIVPDACPDILQILDGEGALFLQRKEPSDGRAEFSGQIQATVLYQPDGEEGVYSLDVNLPFSAQAEGAALTRRCGLTVQPRVQNVDVRLVNPRKIQVRVSFQLEVTGWQPQNLGLCTGAEESEGCQVRQKLGEYRSYQVNSVQEKSFTYSDSQTLPTGLPPIATLLRFRPDCVCTESKVIGSKLVFKGEARISLLYRGENGSLYSTAFPLPFSQIMDAGEAGEESACDVSLLFTEATCRVENEGRAVGLDLALLAQAVLRRTETRPLLTDLYSTTHTLELEQKAYSACELFDQGSAQDTVRQVMECGLPGEGIYDVRVRPGRLTQSKEEGELVLRGEADVFVLYSAQGGLIQSLHRKAPVEHRLPWMEGGEYAASYTIPRDGTATPMGNGIEVTFPVEFTWQAVGSRDLSGIARADVGEPLEPAEGGPSVIIRTVRPGEELWDIAKNYITTEGEIAEANALESGVLQAGQLLLIPRLPRR